MPKYTVTVVKTITRTYQVEGDSPEEASTYVKSGKARMLYWNDEKTTHIAIPALIGDNAPGSDWGAVAVMTTGCGRSAVVGAGKSLGEAIAKEVLCSAKSDYDPKMHENDSMSAARRKK